MTKEKYPVGTIVMEAPRCDCAIKEPFEGVVIGVAAGFRVVRVTKQPSYYDPYKTVAFRVKELIPDTSEVRAILSVFCYKYECLEESYQAVRKSERELDKYLRLAIRDIQIKES